MLAYNLPEPVLSVALEAVGKIQDCDELAVGGLWSVMSKVKDAVADGRRLENLTWRLWHRARIAPNVVAHNSFSGGLPRYPEFLPRPLSSPSLSFSSSSEGTGTSSDWDRDTAVGEDDELQGVQGAGARRSTAVSPLSEKAQLDLALGSSFQSARAFPSSALSSIRQCHQHDSSQGPASDSVRPLPSAPSHSTPHHPLPTDTDAGDHACRLRAQGISLSESQHHSLNPAPATAGLEVPSLSSPHDSISPRTFTTTQEHTSLPSPSNAVPHTGLSAPDTSLFATEVLTATVTASSMPITLTATRKDTLTVGRLMAQLFSEKNTLKATRDMGRHDVHDRDLTSAQFKESSCVHNKQTHITPPKIVEPQPSVAANPSRFVQPSTSPTLAPSSAVTSATSTPRQTFPTVVVVNPTPHPTPPATPSPGMADIPFDLNPAATPIGRPDRSSETGWGGGSGSVNGQLATPVSMNGDARSVDEPTFVMVHPGPDAQPSKGLQTHSSHIDLNTNYKVTPLNSLLPAAAIALPEKPSDFETSSHLPTPASESLHALQVSEMTNCSTKSTPAPIPAFAPCEDKKFFLAAPHSGSGGSGLDSSESPDSLGVGSVSPDKGDVVNAGPLLGARDIGLTLSGRQVRSHREEDIASSFSASSPAGRAPSVTSSRGGSSMSSRLKARQGFGVASGSRRKMTSKKVILAAKESSKKEVKTEVKPTEEVRGKSLERNERAKIAKGKEREAGERREDAPVVSGASKAHVVPTVKSLQQLPSHRSNPSLTHQSQHLRQLPTNPPRRQQSPVRRATPAVEPQPRANPTTPSRLPFHPQLGHLGLGHLPTVPPKQRRPIEITETSSEYETTDTEGDESSWESESCSGDEAVEGNRANPSKPSHNAGESSSKSGRTSGATSNNNNRTRDAGEFARDAALEAQRQRDLFQKLPPRSYSNLAHLPRAKSGLSLLFRPDPSLFPEGHPYRTSRSSQDIMARNWSAPAPPLAMTAVLKRGSTVGPMQATVHAEPVVSSVNSKTNIPGASNGRRSSGPQRGGYRPRVKPEDQEEETDSGEEDPEDAIQVSSSVAQRRLAAIMGPRGVQPQNHRPAPSRATSHPAPPTQIPSPQPVSRTITAPVLMHPYLPDPAPLQTPHTVRRNIISQELDEELRRNLLWERSQNQIQGRPPRAPGSILPGPWRPLTALRPEENAETQTNVSDKAPGKRPFATQRTKSWAGDYHASGW